MADLEPNVTYHQGGISVSPNNLSILSINIHSIRNKRDLLEAEVSRLGHVDVLVISETWIEPGTDEMYNLAGYTAYHESRPDGFGGLSVYIRSAIEHSHLLQESSQGIHVIAVKLRSTRIVATYRRPVNNMYRFLDMLDKSLETNDNCILVGDTNIDLLTTSRNGSLYSDSLDLNSMMVLNKIDPNFNTFPLSGSIIDHFCANFVHKAFELHRIDSGISDHVMQMLVVVDLPAETVERRCTRTQWTKVTRLLEQYVHNVSDKSLSDLHEFLTGAVAAHTHELTPSDEEGNKNDWFSVEINSEMILRDFLNKRRKDPSLNEYERHAALLLYRRQRNKVTSLIREAKKYEVNEMTQAAIGNATKMWRVINYVLTNRKQKDRPILPRELILSDESLTTNPESICDAFIDYFSNVAENLKRDLLQHNTNRPRHLTMMSTYEQQIEVTPVTASEVDAAISSLKDKAAGGCDRIPAWFLKSSRHLLIPFLVEAINDILITGQFPASFKVARLICIPKSGDFRCCKNYRPISILSVLTKVLEKILYNRIFGFLYERDFFHPRQFGFLPSSNTTSAALSASHVMTKSIESGDYVMAVFIDVSKAFDCVNHEILLEKLERGGITGRFHDVLAAYLFNRRLEMHHDGFRSRQGIVAHGVPQGSRLSTLLFLVYVNDIFDLPLNAYMQLYADDILLIYSAKDMRTLYEEANSDLDKIYDWFYNNLLSFNIDKSKYMIITPKGKRTDSEYTLTVKNQPVGRVHVYKYLGLMIDNRLTWNDQIQFIKSKIRPFLAMFRRTAYLLPVETKLAVYYAYIHSHLTYLASIWGSTGCTRLLQLQRLQNKALRYIFWTEYREAQTSTDDLFRKHGILKVVDLIKYEFCVNIFKIRNGMLKTNFAFAVTSESHGYQTRRRSLIQVPRSRTNYNRQSMLHEGVNLFNALPDQIRHASNIVSFKRLLKRHLSPPVSA